MKDEVKTNPEAKKLQDTLPDKSDGKRHLNDEKKKWQSIW